MALFTSHQDVIAGIQTAHVKTKPLLTKKKIVLTGWKEMKVIQIKYFKLVQM